MHRANHTESSLRVKRGRTVKASHRRPELFRVNPSSPNRSEFFMQYLLILILLIPSTIQAQSPQTEVDSVSFEQFKVEMGQFLERAVDLHLEAAMHMSVQKLAYNNFLKGKRKDLPDIYEGGGEKVLLDSYSYIRQGTALLHALEHLEMGQESKNKYRVLLSKSINDVSKRILALVEVQESTDEVKREARRRVMRKLGLDYRK